MMHFVRTFSIMRAYGVRLTAIEKARNYGKIVYIYFFYLVAYLFSYHEKAINALYELA